MVFPYNLRGSFYIPSYLYILYVTEVDWLVKQTDDETLFDFNLCNGVNRY